MKKLLMSLATILLILSACGADQDTTSDIYDQLPINDKDAATSGIVDEMYFLTGSLEDIKDSSILMDAESVGLVWVSFDESVQLDIPLKSKVKVQFNGVIMESYPAQASGFTLEIVELYTEGSLYTKEQFDTMFSDPAVNPVVVWNDRKDQIAFVTLDETQENSYHVYVMDLYSEGAVEVAFVQHELPDLNWFYNQLEVQTSQGRQEFGPDFKAIEAVVVIDSEPMKVEEKDLAYQLTLQVYGDEDNKISIEYYEMSGYAGELVQDYTNQALRKIVDIYSNGYTDVTIQAEILKEDDFVTIGYTGMNNLMGYKIEDYLTLHVPTSVVLTIDQVIGDMEGFKELFNEKTGYVYDEQEGVKVYLIGLELYVTFVPTDDMAQRVNFSFLLEDIEPLLDMNFNTPAS